MTRLRRRAGATARGLALACLALAGTASGGAAQELSDVLARYYEAIGGEEAWKGLQSLRRTGSLDLMGGAMQGQITVVAARPGRLRADLTVQGFHIIQAFDGTTAWMMNPTAGGTEPELADAATTDAMIEQGDLDGPLVDWQDDGDSVSLVGTETVDGTEAFVLDVTFRTGNTSRYYLDAGTYLPMRVVGSRSGTGETVTTMMDYRDIGGGLMAPSRVRSVSPQGDQEVIWETFEVDAEVDDSLFVMPGG